MCPMTDSMAGIRNVCPNSMPAVKSAELRLQYNLQHYPDAEPFPDCMYCQFHAQIHYFSPKAVMEGPLSKTGWLTAVLY